MVFSIRMSSLVHGRSFFVFFAIGRFISRISSLAVVILVKAARAHFFVGRRCLAAAADSLARRRSISWRIAFDDDSHLTMAGDCWREDLGDASRAFLPMIAATLRKLLAV
jgi:hypothetical protein